MLSHYEVNEQTGEKFLRLTIRQWKTSYDPGLKKMGGSLRKDKIDKNDKEYEIHSLKFYKFDDELQEFLLQDELLYDISEKFLDPRAGGFTNDIFLTKNECTYYYLKDKENHRF